MNLQIPLYSAAGALLLFLLIIIILLIKGNRKPEKSLFETFDSFSRRLERIEDMAGKVDNLSRIFTLPHIRGAAGETMLESLLQNWLPAGSYKMQHKFSNGTRVDAVIRLGKFLVPVDSKFPLESLKELIDSENAELSPAVKRIFYKHCEDIATRYILPEEGTMQFALMYIPSEKIYYKVFIGDEGGFMGELLKRGVLPVSPSNIFIYLQTVAYGLRGLNFNRQQKIIVDRLHRLREDFNRLKRQYDVGTTHLKNLQKIWDETSVRLTAMDSAIERMERPDD
ncbi:MAG: DNA recombination protein RmuC [Spirochaetales bacterium]|nr:DNA recombination protein RmuC [Spirochaetales bacterium]